MAFAVVQISSIVVELKKRASSLLTASRSLSKACSNDTGVVAPATEDIPNLLDEATERTRGRMNLGIRIGHIRLDVTTESCKTF